MSSEQDQVFYIKDEPSSDEEETNHADKVSNPDYFEINDEDSDQDDSLPSVSFENSVENENDRISPSIMAELLTQTFKFMIPSSLASHDGPSTSTASKNKKPVTKQKATRKTQISAGTTNVNSPPPETSLEISDEPSDDDSPPPLISNEILESITGIRLGSYPSTSTEGANNQHISGQTLPEGLDTAQPVPSTSSSSAASQNRKKKRKCDCEDEEEPTAKIPLSQTPPNEEQDSEPPFLSEVFNVSKYIAMGCYSKGLEIVESILEKDSTNRRAIFYKGQCLIGLRRYSDLVTFRRSTSKNLRDPEKLGVKNALRMLVESEKGTYTPVHGLLNVSAYMTLEALGEYTGPVEKSTISGKGRGLIATRDISPGELLICHKPYILRQKVHPNETPCPTCRPNQLAKVIYEKLAIEPTSLSSLEFCDLYAGHKRTRDGDWLKNEIAVKDLNELNKTSNHEKNAIMAEIKGRVKTNAFTHFDPDDTRYGIWILPSYLNHSCFDANAWWDGHGNFLMVRAVKPIVAGEEITINYSNALPQDSTRPEVIEKHGFVCDCRLCVMEREEGPEFKVVLDKKLKIFHNKFAHGDKPFNSDAAIAALDNLIELRDPYSRTITTPELFEDLVLLNFGVESVLARMLTDKPREALKYLERIRNLVANTCLAGKAVRLDISIMAVYIKLGDLNEIKRFIELAKQDANVAFGVGKDMDDKEFLNFVTRSNLF